MANAPNDDRSRSFEEAVWQFLDAQLRSTAPDVEELVREYPEFEDQIRQKVDEFQKVDSLFDSLVQAEASDFDASVMAHDLTDRKIGTFELIEKIGRGGMGVVYLARDTKLERSVAIKSMPAEFQTNPTARMRFKSEAKLLASLNHPNIAVIHDIIEQDDDSGYLVLEYIPGQTLAERIADKPVKLEEALSIGRQIAEALQGAYQQRVIHRDVKPSNIKITPEGRIKVLDFGLAKSHRATTETKIGSTIGTVQYDSPEQSRGEIVDERSDLFSVGVILYEMITGRLPFAGEYEAAIRYSISHETPEPIARFKSGTPDELQRVITKLLEKDVSVRYQVCSDETCLLPSTETFRLELPLDVIDVPSLSMHNGHGQREGAYDATPHMRRLLRRKVRANPLGLFRMIAKQLRLEWAARKRANARASRRRFLSSSAAPTKRMYGDEMP